MRCPLGWVAPFLMALSPNIIFRVLFIVVDTIIDLCVMCGLFRDAVVIPPQIAYSLLFMIARGDMLGPETRVTLNLIDVPGTGMYIRVCMRV